MAMSKSWRKTVPPSELLSADGGGEASGHESEIFGGGHVVRTLSWSKVRRSRMDTKLEKPHLLPISLTLTTSSSSSSSLVVAAVAVVVVP
jgi:hypothetical protein